MAISSSWESGYSAVDGASAVDPSGPMSNRSLNQMYVDKEPYWAVESSQSNLLVGAVGDFYFAKHLSKCLEPQVDNADDRLKPALEMITAAAWKTAIISVAATIEGKSRPVRYNAAKLAREQWEAAQVVDGQSVRRPPLPEESLERTKSLPHMIDRVIFEVQKQTGADEGAAVEALTRVKESVDAGSIPELKYVRHIRNKYVGHASHDLAFDEWEDPLGGGIRVDVIAEALAIVIEAYVEFGEITSRYPELRDVLAKPPVGASAEEGEDEREQRIVFSMMANWGNISVFAKVIRASAQMKAEVLADQFQSPPGYGLPKGRESFSRVGELTRQRDLNRRIIDHVGGWVEHHTEHSPGRGEPGFEVVVLALERQDPWDAFPGIYFEDGHKSGRTGWHLSSKAISALLRTSQDGIARSRKRGEIIGFQVDSRWMFPADQFIKVLREPNAGA